MSMTARERAPVPPIVDASWLRERLSVDPTVAICHVGSAMSGADPERAFVAGHLPGARFVSLDEVLAAAPSGTAGRHPLPTPDDFARALGDLGVGDDAVVVAYDDRAGAFAGRLVWMLRILDQPAALLDAGVEAWLATPGSRLARGSTPVVPVERTPRRWPSDALADATTVERHLGGGGVVIDSRDPARYAGEVEPIDPIAGHIPGAINLPFGDNVGIDGRFRSVDDLRARFVDVIDRGDRAIVYCGSGVTACHNALAMEQAGLGRPRVFVDSWSGWVADPARPVATGTRA